MSNILETIESKNYVANIQFDTLPYDPREDAIRNNDNFGTLIAFHSNYNLSDNNDWTKEELLEHIQKEDILSLPVYMYEHSGIALRTTPFNCKWDSGQIGYIFISHANIIKWFGKLDLEQAEKNLIAEIEEYSQYCNGEVYGYQIYKKGESCSDEVNACWGYIGYDHVKETVEDELKFIEESDNES